MTRTDPILKEAYDALSALATTTNFDQMWRMRDALLALEREITRLRIELDVAKGDVPPWME